jgi:hypothetical protein
VKPVFRDLGLRGQGVEDMKAAILIFLTPFLLCLGVYAYTMADVTLCPDGGYVKGNTCVLAPDGRYVDGNPQLAPDGKYVGGKGQLTLCPDGGYTVGECRLMPDGTYR